MSQTLWDLYKSHLHKSNQNADTLHLSICSANVKTADITQRPLPRSDFCASRADGQARTEAQITDRVVWISSDDCATRTELHQLFAEDLRNASRKTPSLHLPQEELSLQTLKGSLLSRRSCTHWRPQNLRAASFPHPAYETVLVSRMAAQHLQVPKNKIDTSFTSNRRPPRVLITSLMPPFTLRSLLIRRTCHCSSLLTTQVLQLRAAINELSASRSVHRT